MDLHEITKKYDRETALCVLICRVFLNTASSRALEHFLLNNPIHWEKLYNFSTLQRIRPIVFHVLSPLKECIKPEALAKFKSFCIQSSMRTLMRQQEASRIMVLLAANGIQSKLYKGVDFAKFAYPHVSMREFSDIDIIISPNAILHIINIMEREGYEMPSKAFFDKFPTQYYRLYKDISFTKMDAVGGTIGFEFHYRPTKKHVNFPFEFSDIIGPDFLSANNKLDSAKYLNLMLISNGLTDYFPNLRSLIDIALIRSNGHVEPPLKQQQLLWSQLSSELFRLPNMDLQVKKTQVGNMIIRQILKKKNAKTSFSILTYLNILTSLGLREKCKTLIRRLSIIFIPTNDNIKSAHYSSFVLYRIIRLVSLIKENTIGQFRRS